jgi:hypothetical protein
MRRSILATGVLLAAPLAGCGTAIATTSVAAPAASPARATVTATPTATHVKVRARAAARTPTRAVDRIASAAERQYRRETSGAVIRADLHRIAGEAGLRSAARSGNVASLKAYVNQRFPNVWYHQHISRLQILRAGKIIVDAGVPFVVDGPSVTLPGGDTLRISIQDEIGFVRLIHRHNPVEVVVRGQGAGHVRSSLPAAATASLPSGGQTTIAGVRYQVHSFRRTALGGEPVQIWILGRG